MSNDYDVIKYLHSGDVIYWLDQDGQRQGPSTITGFYSVGMGNDGRPGQGVYIPLLDGVTTVAAIQIVQRTAVADGSVLRFHAGVVV